MIFKKDSSCWNHRFTLLPHQILTFSRRIGQSKYVTKVNVKWSLKRIPLAEITDLLYYHIWDQILTFSLSIGQSKHVTKVNVKWSLKRIPLAEIKDLLYYHIWDQILTFSRRIGQSKHVTKINRYIELTEMECQVGHEEHLGIGVVVGYALCY